MDKELLQLKAENEELLRKNKELEEENLRLVNIIEDCYKEINNQISLLSSVKVELRRYEVQLDTLKSENSSLKYKFARIEKNPIGKILFKLYRNLRDLKHRIKG